VTTGSCSSRRGKTSASTATPGSLKRTRPSCTGPFRRAHARPVMIRTVRLMKNC
jgi:hypothetical protein